MPDYMDAVQDRAEREREALLRAHLARMAAAGQAAPPRPPQEKPEDRA
jgi:hypothetical protein